MEELTRNHDAQAKEEDYDEDHRGGAFRGREELSSSDTSDEETDTEGKRDTGQEEGIFSDIEEEGSLAENSDVTSGSTVKFGKVGPEKGSVYIKKEGQNNKRKKEMLERHTESKPVSGRRG
jgi:hypothetical protein